MAAIDPLTAGAVLLATAATDAVYVMFTSAVVARKRVPAATWSSVWYLLSSFAVISYTENWVYVAFAAVGSWLGAFASITSCTGRPAARRWAPRRSSSRGLYTVIASASEAIHRAAQEKEWIASSLPLLAMTGEGHGFAFSRHECPKD